MRNALSAPTPRTFTHARILIEDLLFVMALVLVPSILINKLAFFMFDYFGG